MVFPSLYLIEVLGRRRSLLYGAAGQCVSSSSSPHSEATFHRYRDEFSAQLWSRNDCETEILIRFDSDGVLLPGVRFYRCACRQIYSRASRYPA